MLCLSCCSASLLQMRIPLFSTKKNEAEGLEPSWFKSFCFYYFYDKLYIIPLFAGEEMKIRDEYTCPLELTHDITKGKWKPIILWQLGKGKIHYQS